MEDYELVVNVLSVLVSDREMADFFEVLIKQDLRKKHATGSLEMFQLT